MSTMSSSSSPNGTQTSRICDEDLTKKSHAELLRLVRQLDSKNKSIMFDHDNMMKEINRRLQIHIMEIRGLKTVNQKLQDDNLELRDLCCFLDDERQNGKKMAKDWQRFGRYTASVMRSEVSAYQEKLQELEVKQEELIHDNLELQELCLYLGKEQLLDQDRDDGDGSSNGTTAGSEKTEHPVEGAEDQQQNSSISDETLNYIKQLEDKVRRLEEDKSHLAQQLEQNSTETGHNRGPSVTPPSSSGCSAPARAQVVSSHSRPPHRIESVPSLPATIQQHSSKPEAVVHAIKVLEVHQQLERSLNAAGTDHLGDNEKAIVKEMCNVVWRKLEDASPSDAYKRIPLNSSSETYARYHQQSSKGHPMPPKPSHPPQFHTSSHQKSSHLYSPPTQHYQVQQQKQQQQSSSSQPHNFRSNSQPTYQNRSNKSNYQKL